jgi:hypothetical protein
MLIWHRRLWLIDHGAALYFHHAGGDYRPKAREPFARIADHVLLPWASEIASVDAAMPARLRRERVPRHRRADSRCVARGRSLVRDAGEAPDAYVDYLTARMQAPRAFAEEAIRAHSARS